MQNQPQHPKVISAISNLIRAQNDDGGWSIYPESTASETAYVLLALSIIYEHKLYLRSFIHRGRNWLLQNRSSSYSRNEELWIGKELYQPRRVDRVFELVSLIRSAVIL
ncbi:MAG: hypothetical protein HC806_06210 [Anaerolineae bacterium]|nr:hypothetical protein [Anaerolineae bacterium]